MKKLFLLLMAVLSIGMYASAQTRTVNGTVIDAGTEEPLIGASVMAAGEQQGVSTDYDGRFSLSVPANAKHLSVSYIGYETQQVAIVSGEIVVKLEQKNSLLDEVIAVAYGQAKRSEYTGSAGVVKAETLENALVSTVTSALTGQVSGVQTYSSTGQPGSAPSVKIRGTGSINAGSSPLYVVDGVPYPSADVSAISTMDVESMVVLKDAASTALYGARGANGVILITTKRGSEGKARISVDARWGSNSRAIPSYDMVTDQRQFMEMTYQAVANTRMFAKDEDGDFLYGYTAEQANRYINDNIWTIYGGYQTWSMPDGQLPFGRDGKFNPNATPGYSNGRYYFLADDWAEESLINGVRQEYSVSINGGTDRLQYYVSGTYLEDEGIIKGSHFNRLTTRASVDYKANDWLKFGSTLAYIYADQAAPGEQTSDAATSSANVFYFINSMAPIYPVYVRHADGSIMMNELYGNPVYDYGDGIDYGHGLLGASRTPQGSPVGQLLYNTEDYLMDILDANWYAEITPFKGLTFTQNVSYYVDNTRHHYIANGLYGQFATSGGQAMQVQSRLRNITLQSLLNYQITLNDVHDLYALLGYESQDFATESVQAIGSNLYLPLNPYVDNTIDDKRGYGSYAEHAHRGYFIQGKYTYDGRYYVMGSFRRDGSSRFAPGHRWGSFWSLSAGWDIIKESFMADYRSNIDLLKFKASFGQTGNDNIGGSPYMPWADMYAMTGADGVFSDGVLAQKGNTDLTWEKSHSFNTGFDFSFWKGKLTGTVEYFTRKTDDMLFYLPTSPSLGYNSVPSNVGSLRNYGVELDLHYTPIQTKDIQVEVYANATFGKNKVIKLDPSILNADGEWVHSTYRRMREGESMFEYYLPQYKGVNPTSGLAQYLAYTETGLTLDETGKEVPVLDADGNVVEAGNEYLTTDWTTARTTRSKYTGDLSPKVYGGFGVNVKAYGFDLSMAFSYQLGGKVMDSGYQALMHSGSSVSAWHVDALNASQISADGQSNKITDVPMLITEGAFTDYANAVSDRWLTSSDYLSLNNITLGYTLPKSITKKLHLGSIRVYGAAENVALWSARKGLDPRQGIGASDNATYSPIRSISGGIHVDF